MDSASLRVGITTATLSLTGDLESKAGDAGNDRLLTANPASWNSRVLCAGYRLQRNPQFAHVAGGLSDLSARRNA